MSENITNNPSVPSQVVAEVKFPQWVNNLGIIPTSYKDSMSYYETLAWLCKYLEETVIPTVNQNGDAVEELQALYVELNSYVTHYFDNLDVQTEINNKLDEMVIDGTLTTLIGNYIDPYITQFNTRITSIENMVTGITNGNPIPVSNTSEMTDTTKLYVLLSDGYVYYYNGASWVQGWAYQSTSITTDKTLTQIGVPADSNATGTSINSLKNEVRTGKYNILNFNNWQNGNILSTGVDGDTTQTSYPFSIRSVGYTQVLESTCQIKPNGLYIMIFEYNNDYSLNSHTNWITTDTSYTFDSAKLYRINISDYTNRQSSNLLWKDTIQILKEVNSNIIYPKFVTVGTGKQYTTLKSAIDSITDASKNNPYNVLIYEGEYNTLQGFTLASETSDFMGLVIPDYVNLIGIGSNTEIILKAELPSDISSYAFPRDGVSTINVWRNNIVKNLTIKAKNMRYAIHNDDYKTRAVENAEELFEDLIVIYEENDSGITSVSVPMGVGAYNGRNTIIRNCKFNGEIAKGHSLLIHNNVSSPNRCTWLIENCRFNGNLYSIGLSSAGSLQLDQVVLKGSKLEKNIRYSKQSSYTGSTNEFYLTGYYNVIPGYSYSNITEDSSLIDVF